jgi:hypothetical protein
MYLRNRALGVAVNALGDSRAIADWASIVSAIARRAIFLTMFVLSVALPTAVRAQAQLPEAPTASEIAPLKRFSLTVGLESSYSLTTTLNNVTPRLGLSLRLGQHETLGLSYSHATGMNQQHQQNNTVVASLNIRVWSWGRIPAEH